MRSEPFGVQMVNAEPTATETVWGRWLSMGSLMRKILSLMLVGSAFLVVPSVASANIVKGGDTAFARTILGSHRDVGVHHGDVRLGPNGSITVGANVNNQPTFAEPVPEPTTWAMMLLGFGLVGYASRRRRHTRPRQVA